MVIINKSSPNEKQNRKKFETNELRIIIENYYHHYHRQKKREKKSSSQKKTKRYLNMKTTEENGKKILRSRWPTKQHDHNFYGLATTINNNILYASSS